MGLSLLPGVPVTEWLDTAQVNPGSIREAALRLWQSEGHFFFFCFLGPHLWHMEVPRLGVESELQRLVYTTATAMPDP